MARTKGSKNGKFGAVINKEQFEKLCKIMCTQEEIMDVFGVSNDTIIRFCKQNYNGMTFAEAYKVLTSTGKASLRRIQFEQAETNPSMAIWLGKQYLGQKDAIENTNIERIEVIDDVKADD